MMGVMREDKKGRKSHIDVANQWVMEMPINRYQREEQGLPCNECTKSYKCMKAQYETKWVCI